MMAFPYSCVGIIVLLCFLHISGQTTQGINLKLGGYIHIYCTHQAWLTFGYASLNFHHFPASDWSSSFCAFGHLQTNSWSDWAHTWWTNLLWVSPSLINFWSCYTGFPPFSSLWLVDLFPPICIDLQSTEKIELKFGGATHYESLPTWLTFGYRLFSNIRCVLW